MAAEDTGLAKLDAFLAGIFTDWNIYTTVLAAAVVIFVGYSLFSSTTPDVYPYLLARQSNEAPVRQPGESAVFRSLETPHWLPLRTGLNIRDPDIPKWAGGRNGDLRDIWKAAIRGVQNGDGTLSGTRGKIYTVLGKNLIEHYLDDITQEINVIGKYINDAKAKTVVLSLSDSVELLAAVFAGAFYGFHIYIVPRNIPAEDLSAHLRKAQAEVLIAEAGAVDLPTITKDNEQLKHAIWVAKQGSRHMDWNDVPDGIGGGLEVSVWHELVNDRKDVVGRELPTFDHTTTTTPVTTLWPSSSGIGEFVEYTPQSLIAGIGALSSVLPLAQKLTHQDLVLSIDSLSRLYPLCWIMVALYSNSSIALTSVAGESVDFALATMGVSPTAIITSSRTLSNYHKHIMLPSSGFISKIARWVQSQSLEAGCMPSRNLLSQLAYIGPTAELSLERLRLLLVSFRVDDDPEDCLGCDQLTDLRIFTSARLLYSLIGPGVAGAVAQTHVFDYRKYDGPTHFGAPSSSVEITLTGHQEDSGLERAVEGQITVAGPAVASKKIILPARGRFRDDNTLQLCAKR
jgi:hypothetical protein